MKTIMRVGAALLALAASLVWTTGTASAATSSPPSAAHNTIYTASFDDGGAGTCTFNFQFGNVYATPYAKFDLRSGNCYQASASVTSHNSSTGAYDIQYGSFSGGSLPTGWRQTNGPLYYSIIQAQFYVQNSAGYAFCLVYNAISGARIYNYVGSSCPP